MKNILGMLAVFVLGNVGYAATTQAAPLICGDQDTLQVEINAQWPAMKGSAVAEGPVLADFLGGSNTPFSMPCSRQGGSSMKPWWICKASQDDKSIELVLGLDPAIEVTFVQGTDVMQEHLLSCTLGD